MSPVLKPCRCISPIRPSRSPWLNPASPFVCPCSPLTATVSVEADRRPIVPASNPAHGRHRHLRPPTRARTFQRRILIVRHRQRLCRTPRRASRSVPAATVLARQPSPARHAAPGAPGVHSGPQESQQSRPSARHRRLHRRSHPRRKLHVELRHLHRQPAIRAHANSPPPRPSSPRTQPAQTSPHTGRSPGSSS